jgi:hypothetical protein
MPELRALLKDVVLTPWGHLDISHNPEIALRIVRVLDKLFCG